MLYQPWQLILVLHFSPHVDTPHGVSLLQMTNNCNIVCPHLYDALADAINPHGSHYLPAIVTDGRSYAKRARKSVSCRPCL